MGWSLKRVRNGRKTTVGKQSETMVELPYLVAALPEQELASSVGTIVGEQELVHAGLLELAVIVRGVAASCRDGREWRRGALQLNALAVG